MSVALLTGVAGLPTLGQTAPYAVGAYTAATLRPARRRRRRRAAARRGRRRGRCSPLVTAPLVVHARGVVVLMITLAIGELTATAAGRWKSVTGGTDGMLGLRRAARCWGIAALDTDRAALPVRPRRRRGAGRRRAAGAALPGRRCCCAPRRDDEARMRASGHPVAGYLVGRLRRRRRDRRGRPARCWSPSQQYVSPADVGFDIAALLLLAVVIGGAASIGGALVGAALVVAVRDWLAGVAARPRAAAARRAVRRSASYLAARGGAARTTRGAAIADRRPAASDRATAATP